MVALYWDGLGGYLKCCSIQRKPPLFSAPLPQGWANQSEEHDKLSAPSQLYTDSSLEIQDRSVTLKMSANTDQAWQKGCLSRLGVGRGTGQGKTSANMVKCTASFSLPPISTSEGFFTDPKTLWPPLQQSHVEYTTTWTARSIQQGLPEAKQGWQLLGTIPVSSLPKRQV